MLCPTRMENRLEKEMEHEMDTGSIGVFREYTIRLRVYGLGTLKDVMGTMQGYSGTGCGAARFTGSGLK